MKKTETRRIWKRKRVNVGSIQKAKTKMISKDFFSYLYVLEVHQERLGDISDESIRAEGYESLEAYKEALQRANKRKKFVWDDNLVVWVVKFVLCDYLGPKESPFTIVPKMDVEYSGTFEIKEYGSQVNDT